MGIKDKKKSNEPLPEVTYSIGNQSTSPLTSLKGSIKSDLTGKGYRDKFRNIVTDLRNTRPPRALWKQWGRV